MSKVPIILVTLAVFGTGCGGAEHNSSSTSSMTGNWIFFVTSQKFVGGSDRGTGALVQSGNGVTGTLNFTGGCLNTAPLSGTLQQSALTFQLTENGQPASFTGTVDPRFSSASGSWTTVQGGCGDGDFGIWNAIKRLTPD